MKIVIKLFIAIMLIISTYTYSNDSVCFYTEDNFQGNSTCLSSGQQIDLYAEFKKTLHSGKNPAIIDNDSIRSIKIPLGMMATVYKNDSFSPPFFSLTENINAAELKRLGMKDDISIFKVSENNKLNCNIKCTIFGTYTLKLPSAFDQYWHDKRLLNKQVILIFNSRYKQAFDGYSINLLNGPSINVTGKDIVFSDYNTFNEFSFEYKKNSNELAIIIGISNDIVKLQYIQTLKKISIHISNYII